MVTLVGGGKGAESRLQTRGPLAEGNTAGPYGAAVVEWSPGTTTRWAWLLLSPAGAGEGQSREGRGEKEDSSQRTGGGGKKCTICCSEER